jgi:cell division septation protein DedD
MAENRRHRDKRFYFSRGQLVLLGGAFTLASLIIFFLGIVVGRGIEERKMARPEEPLIKIPVKPPTQSGGAASTGQAKEELTFYDTLGKSSRDVPSMEEKAGEHKEAAKTIKPEPKEVKPQGRERATSTALKVEEKTAANKPNPSPSPHPIEPSEPGKAWYVQVNAFPDEKSGQIWVDRLKNKGYNAYLTEGRNQGKLWYRVRVGRYGSREEAEKIAEVLKTKENLTKAFATRQ